MKLSRSEGRLPIRPRSVDVLGAREEITVKDSFDPKKDITPKEWNSIVEFMQTTSLGMRSFAQAALAVEVMDHEKVEQFRLDKKQLQSITKGLKDTLVNSDFFDNEENTGAFDFAEVAGLVKLNDHMLFRQNVDLSFSVINGVKRNWLDVYRRGGMHYQWNMLAHIIMYYTYLDPRLKEKLIQPGDKEAIALAIQEFKQKKDWKGFIEASSAFRVLFPEDVSLAEITQEDWIHIQKYLQTMREEGERGDWRGFISTAASLTIISSKKLEFLRNGRIRVQPKPPKPQPLTSQPPLPERGMVV